MFSLQNFKLFLRAKAEFDKGKKDPSPLEAMPAPIKTHYNRVVEQLNGIDEVSREKERESKSERERVREKE